jgi:hypothetical protein
MTDAQDETRRQSLHRIATAFSDAARVHLTDTEIDLLRHEYDLNVSFARDSESNRSTMMTFIVTAVAAIIYALSAVKFDPRYWPLSVIVMLLGLYATSLSNIYHERWEYFMMIARGYRWRIAASRPDLQLEEVRFAAKQAHREQFPRQRQLYRFWSWMGVGLSVLGLASAVAMIVLMIFGHAR